MKTGAASTSLLLYAQGSKGHFIKVVLKVEEDGWTTGQMKERKEWRKRGVGRHTVKKTRY